MRLRGLSASTGGGSPALDGGDHLRLGDNGAGPAGIVDLDGYQGFKGEHLDALGDGAFHLFGKRGHVCQAATVDAGDLSGPGAHGGAAAVHGHVTASDDGDFLPREVGIFAIADLAEHIDGRHDPFGIGSFEGELLAHLGPDGNVYGVELLGDTLHLLGVDLRLGLNVDIAHGQHGSHVLVKALPGEAVRRDAVSGHAAKLLAGFEDRDAMPHEGQEVRARHAGGTAAYDRNAAPGVGMAPRHIHLVGGNAVYGELLDAADVDGRVEQHATATRLARTLAHHGAHGRERIVLADEADGLIAAPFFDQGDITRDVHMRGAHGLAGDLLADLLGTCSRLQVSLEFVGEHVHGGQNVLGRLVAYGAIGAVTHDLSSGAQRIDDTRGGGPILDGPQHPGDLRQAVAAGHALAARLSRAGLDACENSRDGARARRGGLHPAFRPLDELAYGSVVPRRGANR